MSVLLAVDGVSKRFRGLVAVDRVSVEVPQGSIFAVIGPNGAGKTTLFNMIAGVFAPDGGSIKFAGEQIEGLPPDRVCRGGIGRTFQIVRPFPALSVEDNVIVGALLHRHHARDAPLPSIERDLPRRFRFFDCLYHRPRAPRNRFVLRPRCNGFEHLACVTGRRLGGLFQGRDPGVLVVRLQRDIQQLRRVGEARDGVERRLRIRRVPGYAAKRLAVVHPPERRRANRVVRRRSRDGRVLLLIVQSVERPGGVRLRTLHRDDHKPLAELAAQVRVRFRPRETHERFDVADALAGGSAHADVLVARRELEQDFVARGFVWDFRDGRRANRRIRVLPPGLGLETIEERHSRPYK